MPSTNYPPPLKAPDMPYSNPPGTNPRVSGMPLRILSSLVSSIGPLQKILWNNAGFGTLRSLESSGALNAFLPRFDPTVIPAIPAIPEPAIVKSSESASPFPHTTTADYIAAYKSGKTTPRDVVEFLLATLDEDSRNLFISRTAASDLLAAADASTARYASGTPLPLDGIPIVLKDELDVLGTSRTLGLSPAEAAARIPGGPSTATSWCVQKLLDAGVLNLGKSNMHELGVDTLNNNPWYGTPRNPVNANYYPGGSSGGSGAAVGAGIVPIAIGADGGGSIRIPATYCGVCGLKPTHGRVSRAPTLSIAPSVGVAGPIGASVPDLRLAYSIMATPNPAEGTTFPTLFGRPAKSPKKVLGVYREWINDCDDVVRTAVNAALEVYETEVGYEIVPITLPHLGASQTAHAITILSEIGQTFCGLSGTRGLSPSTSLIVAVSNKTPARDFLLAQRLRSLMMSHLSALFQTHPGMIIVSPATPHVGVKVHAPGLEGRVSDANTALRSMQYTFLANWTGCPAVSFPVAWDAEEGGSGMGVGLMGMGEWADEEGLLVFGEEWEARWEGRRAAGVRPLERTRE